MIILLGSLLQLAEATPYTLPITRNAKKYTMVASPWWGGEYPGPIIEVSSAEKTVLVKGYVSLRELNELKKCTIKTGVYHPWSKGKTSIDTFYTIAPLIQYQVTKDNAELELKEGDLLDMELYMGENFCSYIQVSGKKRGEVSHSCDTPKDEKMKKIATPAHPLEQWLYLNCKEGHKVFIQDKELHKQTGNKTGQMCGYGYVEKQGEKCQDIE